MRPHVIGATNRRRCLEGALAGILILLTLGGTSLAHADNQRLNDGVVVNVYTIKRQVGCLNDVAISPQLRLAAQRHASDVLNNRALNADIGSDSSTPQDRAIAAGYHGAVSQTVAINASLAMSGIELINQWYHDPVDLAIMQDCAFTQIGVWSENRFDRTVVVAVHGQPA